MPRHRHRRPDRRPTVILRTFTQYDMDGTTIKEYPVTPRTLAPTIRRALHDLNYRPSEQTVTRIAVNLYRNGRSVYALTRLTLEEK